ncbi:MAG: hypothetical protein ACFCGT_11390 [Sandaracinaceae bacterium]
MMWVGIATAIMLGSGSGDDFGDLQRTLDALRDAVREVVDDPDQRAEALHAIVDLDEVVELVLDSAVEIADCIERADRSYDADREVYDRCGRQYDEAIVRIGHRYRAAERRYEAAVSDEDERAINELVRQRIQP